MPTATQERSDSSRIVELDGLRGIAVWGVLVWHLISIPCIGSDNQILREIGATLRIGRTGVDLFFLLSGFLIGGILLANREAPNYFSVFYARRAFRIAPIYYLLVIPVLLNAAGLISFNILGTGVIPAWTYAFYLQNFWMAAHETYGGLWLNVTWSLAIEEQFYLVAPLIIRFTPVQFMPALCLTGAAIAMIGRPFAYFYTGSHYASYMLAPLRMDSLLLGILVAYLVKNHRDQTFRLFDRYNFFLRILLPGVFLYLLISVRWNNDIHMMTWGHSFLTIFFAWILLWLLRNRATSKAGLFRLPPLTGSGQISYGMYLYHPIVMYFCMKLLHTSNCLNSPRDLLMVVFAILGSISVSWLSFRFFEAPMLGLAHRWRYRTPHFTTI